MRLKMSTDASSIDVNVEVSTPAEQATMALSSNGGSFNGFALSGNLTLEIAGKEGAQTLTFASGTQQSAMVDAFNLISDIFEHLKGQSQALWPMFIQQLGAGLTHKEPGGGQPWDASVPGRHRMRGLGLSPTHRRLFCRVLFAHSA